MDARRRHKAFTPREGDRPLAEFIYLVPIADKNARPKPIDAELPEALSVTGIQVSTATPVSENAKLPGTDDGFSKMSSKLQPKSESMLPKITDADTARLPT